MLGIGAEYRQHVRRYGAEPSPRLDFFRRGERGTDLFSGDADFFHAARCGTWIESDTFHRAPANREIASRDNVAARSICNVAKGCRTVGDQLAACWLHATCVLCSGDFSGPRASGDDNPTRLVPLG